MTPAPIDDRSTRDGRSLGEWLSSLIDADRPTRRAAENAVSAMHWGVPVADATLYLHLPAELPVHRRAFGDAVAAALLDPSFDGRGYLERLVATIRADATEASRRFDLERRIDDLTFDVDDDGNVASPADEATLAPLRAEAARLRADVEAGRLPNSHGTHALNVILGAAGEALLRWPDLARTWLAARDLAGRIGAAIASLGSRGAIFAPDLIVGLESAVRAGNDANVQSFQEAIASVAVADRASVARLATLARSADDRVAGAAIETLRQIGPAARSLVPTIVDDLLSADADENAAAWRLRALAAIDPTRRDVFDRLVALARPSPPRMREVEGHADYEYDEVMYRRGAAIEALGEFAAFADEAADVLNDAVATFEEYAPDWGYEQGTHGRAIASLARLGRVGARAVPTLIPRLREGGGEIDWRVVRFFGDLGAAANAALPALRRLDAEIGADDRVTGTEPDRLDDAIGWAIWRISNGLG